LILPYLEQTNVYNAYRTAITGVTMTDGFNNHNSTDPAIVMARQASVKVYLCPSRHSPPALSPITTGSTVTGVSSDYAACAGDTPTAPTTGVLPAVNTNHTTAVVRITDITDGTSTTFMIGEKHIQQGFLQDPITDGMIYSGGETQTYSRAAGVSW